MEYSTPNITPSGLIALENLMYSKALYISYLFLTINSSTGLKMKGAKDGEAKDMGIGSPHTAQRKMAPSPLNIYIYIYIYHRV